MPEHVAEPVVAAVAAVELVVAAGLVVVVVEPVVAVEPAVAVEPVVVEADCDAGYFEPAVVVEEPRAVAVYTGAVVVGTYR